MRSIALLCTLLAVLGWSEVRRCNATRAAHFEVPQDEGGPSRQSLEAETSENEASWKMDDRVSRTQERLLFLNSPAFGAQYDYELFFEDGIISCESDKSSKTKGILSCLQNKVQALAAIASIRVFAPPYLLGLWQSSWAPQLFGKPKFTSEKLVPTCRATVAKGDNFGNVENHHEIMYNEATAFCEVTRCSWHTKDLTTRQIEIYHAKIEGFKPRRTEVCKGLTLLMMKGDELHTNRGLLTLLADSELRVVRYDLQPFLALRPIKGGKPRLLFKWAYLPSKERKITCTSFDSADVEKGNTEAIPFEGQLRIEAFALKMQCNGLDKEAFAQTDHYRLFTWDGAMCHPAMLGLTS